MTKEFLLNEYFLYETEGWRRLLSFLIDQNILLKTQLSELLKSLDFREENDGVEKIENFQNNFLQEDIGIQFLRSDINKHEKYLKQQDLSKNNLVVNIKMNHMKLRNEIERMEKDFNKLKFEFNNYVSSFF